MIQVIRHAGLRLWLLLIWGLPAGFWLLARAMAWLPDLSPGTAMALFLAVAGTLQGLILDLIGRWRILGLIREGELWEQAGIRSRAEKRYVRAVRIFDSVLVSPWSARSLSRKLTRALAGFYLTGQVRYQGFCQAAARYLLYQPKDESLAVLWLEKYLACFRETQDDGLTRSVLTALAEVHHNHPKISVKLAIPFLEQERNDLPARRLYRSVLKRLETEKEASFPKGYKQRMEDLLKPEVSLAGSGLSPEAGTDNASEALFSGTTLGDQVFSAEMPGSAGLRQQGRFSGAGAWRRRTISGAAGGAGAAARFLGRMMAAAGVWTGKLLQGIRSVLREKDRVRQYVKYTLISALAVWLGVFLWTSLAHMLKSTSTEPVLHSVGSLADGPFTIQVAAYLKQTHADRYVQKLTAKGVTAHIKKTLGGGKTWYLVRVSHFKTKQQAAAFGTKLKSEGKIDDFFVSNT